MLKIVGREIIRACHVVNRVRVIYNRTKIPKVEPTSINVNKGYSQLRLNENDVDVYQDSSRVILCVIYSIIDCIICGFKEEQRKLYR